MFRSRHTTLRRAFAKAALLLLGATAPLVVAELALRVKHDALFVFEDLRPAPWSGKSVFTEYDPTLGWVPRPNASVDRPAGWSASTDDRGFRRNHPPSEVASSAGPPVLAIGDSGAFGDEVDDDETWPAHLESRLGRRVLNAGVSAYGIDQAVLRAERLLPQLEPTIVVFSIVSDDVTRTALQFWNRWKPYFRLQDGELRLVPPPPPDTPLPESWWRRALGRSQVARFAMEKVFPEAWEHRVRRRAHHDEVAVSGLLLERLRESVRSHEGRLLVVLIAGGNADVEYIPALRADALEAEIAVLDLSGRLARLARDPSANHRMFRPKYHLSSEGNAWIAEQITGRLIELGWVQER